MVGCPAGCLAVLGVLVLCWLCGSYCLLVLGCGVVLIYFICCGFGFFKCFFLLCLCCMILFGLVFFLSSLGFWAGVFGFWFFVFFLVFVSLFVFSWGLYTWGCRVLWLFVL